MKTKKFTQGITITLTPEMYEEVKRESDKLEISLSEFFRSIIGKYYECRRSNQEEGDVYEMKPLMEHDSNENK
jgi:hypothetical protein